LPRAHPGATFKDMGEGIYLDYNATTPVDPRVARAMLPWLEKEFGNPSSAHLWGARARQALEEARRKVAAFLDAEPGEILFTSGGTESNNLAIRGAVRALRPRGGHIVATAVEHPAVLEVLSALKEEADCDYTLVPVDRNCRVRPGAVLEALRPETVLVTVMLANNEVGALQPVEETARLVRERGILFHTDASQAAGKIPFDAKTLGADLLTLAGHKLYAPKGVGALFVRKGIPLRPVLRGAGQERGLRPGTEPVMLAVGLGEAARIAGEELAGGEAERLAALRDRMEELLLERIPGAGIHAREASRLPNTTSLFVPGILGPDLVAQVGMELAVSAGAACHQDTREVSHVLRAMGVPEEAGLGTLRISVGRFTKEEEIEPAVRILARAVEDARRGGREGK